MKNKSAEYGKCIRIQAEDPLHNISRAAHEKNGFLLVRDCATHKLSSIIHMSRVACKMDI